MRHWAWVTGVVCCTLGCSGSDEAASEVDPGALQDPLSAAMQAEAPAEFSVVFKTSAGDFTVAVERALAPRGADRFYNLVRHGYYDDQRFFRVVPGFVVQWGMSGSPDLTRTWQQATFDDDPVQGSNTPGTITFAKTGAPNSRTTQLFINLGTNTRLDGMGFAPFGRVVQGMDVVQAINAEYGESPNQGQIATRGNEYLMTQFPRLDYIESARLVD